MNTKNFVIDGGSITSEADFHVQIASLLNFPTNYGKNLDAFWDYLTDCAGNWRGMQVSIEWRDHLRSKEALGERCFSVIVKMFYDFQKDWKKDFEFTLN